MREIVNNSDINEEFLMQYIMYIIKDRSGTKLCFMELLAQNISRVSYYERFCSQIITGNESQDNRSHGEFQKKE